MAVEPGKFACESCGRSFRWTAALAGKRVKCKCGAVLRVPAEEPGGEEAEPDFGALEPAEEPAGTAHTPAAAKPPAYSAGAGAKAQKPTESAKSGEKVKWTERWWFYVGMGVLMVPIAILEYSRLSDLENAAGPESIRVSQLEHAVYSTLGKMGVLIVFILLGLGMIGFGVHKFLKARRGAG